MGSDVVQAVARRALRHVDGPETISNLRYDDGGGDLLAIPPGARPQRWIPRPAGSRHGDPKRLGGVGPAETRARTRQHNGRWHRKRSATGRPLLAGDPHRVFEMPSCMAQDAFACDRFDAMAQACRACRPAAFRDITARSAWLSDQAFMDNTRTVRTRRFRRKRLRFPAVPGKGRR